MAEILHYAENGIPITLVCGTKEANQAFTTIKGNVTCPQCRDWLQNRAAALSGNGPTFPSVGVETWEEDPEIRALRIIQEAMEPLDAAARDRVINWAWDRYHVESKPEDIKLL